MSKESILENLYYGKVSGYPERRTPEEAESEFYYDVLMKELKKHIPKYDNDTENHFFDLVNLYTSAKEETAFKRGLRFATAFMSEALQPPVRTRSDFEGTLKLVTGIEVIPRCGGENI